jgi:two-component system CheB/CheR fusion protein
MVLAERALVPFSVQGVDRSESAIEQARRGSYPSESQRQIPQAFSRFVGTRDGKLEVVDELRAKANFSCIDLLSGPPALRYELVICKNVLIYLRPEVALELLRALGNVLVPGGVLLVARAELAAAKAAGFVTQTLAPGVSVLSTGA